MKDMRVDVVTSIDEVFKIHSKILHFLSTHYELEFNSNVLELLIKMAVVFNESVQLREENFLKKNYKNNGTFPGIQMKKYFNEAETYSSFAFLANKIFRSQGVIKNTVIFDNVLKTLKNIPTEENFGTLSRYDCSCNVNRKKMCMIIERIFVLPCLEIKIAIEKVISNVDFHILGQVFCESANSIYFDKCSIIADEICNCIKNSKKCITNFFIPSLLSSVSNSNTGRFLFQKCLRNKEFSSSLYIYINNNLTTFKLLFCSTQIRISNFANIFLLYTLYIVFKEEKGSENVFNNLEHSFHTILNDPLSFINVLFA